MASIFDTLIYNRTATDVNDVVVVGKKIANGTATADEIAAWNNGMKGAISPQDLTRIRNVLLFFQSWLSNNNISFTVNMIDPTTQSTKFFANTSLFPVDDIQDLADLLKYPFADVQAFSVPQTTMKSTDLKKFVFTYSMWNMIEKALNDCRPTFSWRYKGSDVWYSFQWDETNMDTGNKVYWPAMLRNAGFEINEIEEIVINSFVYGSERAYAGSNQWPTMKLSVLRLNIQKVERVRVIDNSIPSFKIELSERVEEIDASAFRSCTLTEITMPSSLKTIGNDAFRSCHRMKSPEFKEGLLSLGDYAFYDDDNIKEIILPNSNTTIGYQCFAFCGALEKVVFGSGLTSIPDMALYACSKLNDVTIGVGVTYLGENIFLGCTLLTEITYAGTMAQWAAITKEAIWDQGSLNGTVYITVIHCSDGDVTN